MSEWLASIGPAVGDHLWQSTVFAVAAALLTVLLKKNQARARYWIWLAALMKFLVPFSLLIALGGLLPRPQSAPVATPTAYAAMSTMDTISEPFAAQASPVLPTHAAKNKYTLPETLASAWLCGLVVVVAIWCTRWRRVAAMVREATEPDAGRELEMLRRLERDADMRPVRLLLSQSSMEPGMFGVVRPVLLWPQGISARLSDAQMEAILAHELCHVRRRDNLFAVAQMVVETVLWFYPLVWWMGARMVEERERACDEEVLGQGRNAETYAESILKICEFCLESPLACVSGITGADLKHRIVQIMTQQAGRKLDLSRKLILCVVATIVVALPVTFGLVHAAQAHAQSATAAPVPASATQGIAGTWQGTLRHAGQDLRTVVKITEVGDGGYKASFHSIDQGGQPIPVEKVTLDGATVQMLIPANGSTFEGKLSADGMSIAGDWTQGPNPVPLTLTRVTPATEWTVPVAIPPMAANADPGFEVATIKPSSPDEPGKRFGWRGGHLITTMTNLNDLIAFAYGLHAKQIVDAPAWFGTDLYDIEGKPDTEGLPSMKQLGMMVQELLADRFKLTFHHDKRELSVYVISLASGGPKMTKSTASPDDDQGFTFKRLGNLTVSNMTIADFASWMQSGVMDRPVVDQTGLTDRYDFQLKWTPDESQFGQFRGSGTTVHPPNDNPDAPPSLYTALQEQLGLKMRPGKVPDDVIVIDHVERPSPN